MANNKIKTSVIGCVYNSLTIISEPISILLSGKKRRMVKCVCVCGKEIDTLLNSVMSGHTSSCGCINLIYKDRIKAKKMRISFNAMHARCNSDDPEKAKYYKNKGIYVCKRWEKFENFYEDMHESWEIGKQLDRHPNTNGIYELSNCRWATVFEQQRNKPNLILDEQKAVEIRNSNLSINELSIIYKTSPNNIGRVKNEKRWKMVK